MVGLVPLAQSAEDRHGVVDGGLAHVDLLEAALQRRILLDALAVLVERRGADHTQFTAGQHGLEHVARVHRALARGTGADDRVQLVDEGDDLPLGLLDLGEDGLEALLELAAVLGAGHHRCEVEGDEAAALERIRHVAGHEALGEALDDGGLADAGLADQHGVVLGATCEHLHDAADLLIAADHRVELAVAGPLGEVDGVLLEDGFPALGFRGGHALAAAGGLEGLLQRIRGDARAVEHGLGIRLDGGQADEQVLGGDEVIREGLRRGEDARERPAQGGLADGAARRRGQLLDGGDGGLVHLTGVGADGLEQRADGVVRGEQKAVQQVHGFSVGVAVGESLPDRRRDGVPRLRRKPFGVQGEVS